MPEMQPHFTTETEHRSKDCLKQLINTINNPRTTLAEKVDLLDTLDEAYVEHEADTVALACQVARCAFTCISVTEGSTMSVVHQSGNDVCGSNL